MAGDPHARLREALGVGPGVILSEDEITKALASLKPSEAEDIRAQLASTTAAPAKRYAFGGVRR